jgi:transposase-like protein
VSALDLSSKFMELEIRRQADVQALDETIEAIKDLLDLDRKLVKFGLQTDHQLVHPEAVPAGPVHEYLGVTEAATPPPEVSEVESVPAAETKPTGMQPFTKSARVRRFTDEQKTAAVRLADELGSDSKAAQESGTTSTSILNWRKQGFGKKMKSVSETAPARPSAAKDAHDGPKTKCSVCQALVPIDGEVNADSRLEAIRGHYKDSPSCADALRKRHA